MADGAFAYDYSFTPIASRCEFGLTAREPPNPHCLSVRSPV